MSHTTHHKKKDDSEAMFKEAMEKELEKVPGVDPESGEQRISSTGESVVLTEEEFRRLKLLS